MSTNLKNIRSLGYRTDLMLLELGGSHIEEADGHLIIRTPLNPTFWWGNFLLYDHSPGPGEVTIWQTDFRTAFPEARHMAFGIDAVSGQLDDVAPEIEAAGLELAHSSVMTANQSNLKSPERPNLGAEYRRLSSDDDWAQALALRLACNENLEAASYRRYAERKTAEARRLAEAGHGNWFGAFLNGRMETGMGLYTDGSGVARFQNVETHPSARQRGLASSLVHFVAQFGFRSMEAQTLVMVADPDYLAIRLYRSLGFQESETQLAVEKPPPGERL